MIKDVSYKLEHDQDSLVRELTEILELPVVKVKYHLEEDPVRHFLEFYISEDPLGRIEYAEFNRLESRKDAVSRSSVWRFDTWDKYIRDNTDLFSRLIKRKLVINEFTIEAGNIHELICWEPQKDNVIMKRNMLSKVEIRYCDEKWLVKIDNE